ncbi:hypothetical protein F4553_007698 [Allocatelliglobosispora scoriae]|uniref:Uncharacterized protein n=1 Tax=Allocatelliglobosispora scoriae TaxID=643052 RepID=A0A841C1N0_9ACTN|nr:hypothetical protein [Allocatelliglobosispora scoriae]
MSRKGPSAPSSSASRSLTATRTPSANRDVVGAPGTSMPA